MNKVFNFFKRFWWIILIGFLVGAFVTYNQTQAKEKATKQKSFVVKRITLTDSLSISGQIDATEKANLQFQTSGLLSWVGVKEGDYVKKFQVVASLDQRQLKNQMSQQLNDYMKNRWTFEQAQQDNKNWQTNGMSDTARDTVRRTMEKYQFDLNNAVLDVEANDLSLKFANLWTPIEGLVTSVDTPNAGVNVTPTSANFMVINPKTIYFSATADQTEIGKFLVGQKGELILDAFPEEPIETEIKMVGFTPKSGETGTVYELRMSITGDNSTYKYKMGMTGDVSFVFKEDKDVIAVPEAYITKIEGKSYVTKMVNDKPEKIEVITGTTIDGNTEIISGISENDTIYY